jgi:AraC-like DNA-binding protein
MVALLRPGSFAAAGFNLGGEWAIQFPPDNGIKCYALVSGHCWLQVEGESDPLHATAGDCLVLPQGRAFRVASDLKVAPIDAEALYEETPEGGITTYKGGGDVFGIAGHFEVPGGNSGLLLGLLPAIVHLHKESDKALLRGSVERMREELREPQPGSVLVLRQLALMMLVQALRLHVASGANDAGGWLSALADRQLSAALGAMHADPGRRWTLQSLADVAGMSRTSLAVKFRAVVGESPIEYLTRWRMLRAGERLENSKDSVALIARSIGYESEAAFSTAFKRAMGCSPRSYSRGQASAIGSPRVR